MTTSWRSARAGALTLVTVVLAAGAHASAGGSLPSLWVLLALTLPTFGAAFALAGRRPSTPITLVALAASQFLLHQGFAALAGEGCSTHHVVVTACASTPHAHGSGVGMLAAHVLATAVTGILLARGEQALFALADRLAWRLPALQRVSLPVLPRLPRPVERRVRPRLVDAVVPVRRGPPPVLRVA